MAFIGLVVGKCLLISRFGLLAGTVQDGVDPSTQAWGLNATGWILVLLPFVVFVAGWIFGLAGKSEENEDSVIDLVT